MSAKTVTAHTPGPWEPHIVRAEVDVNAIWGIVAQIPDRIPQAERIANARLIAAAPELLEACRWMIDQVAEPIHNGDPVLSDYAVRFWSARAAIAKAEGRS